MDHIIGIRANESWNKTLKAKESRMDQLENDNADIREEQWRMNEEIQMSREESNFLIQQLMDSIEDQFAELH